MKLSEAIRLGAMSTRHETDRTFSYDGRAVCGTCAIGAAAFAVGITDILSGFTAGYSDGDFGVLAARFPLLNQIVEWPVQHSGRHAVGQIASHLNDRKYGWTREQIADWVETIELQTTPAASREEVGTKEHAVAPSVSASVMIELTQR